MAPNGGVDEDITRENEIAWVFFFLFVFGLLVFGCVVFWFFLNHPKFRSYLIVLIIKDYTASENY